MITRVGAAVYRAWRESDGKRQRYAESVYEKLLNLIRSMDHAYQYSLLRLIPP